jgi:hypothetical protein
MKCLAPVLLLILLVATPALAEVEEEPKSLPLETPINDLPLSCRAKKALIRCCYAKGFDHRDDVILGNVKDVTRDQIMSQKNCGITTANEILMLFHDLGFRLEGPEYYQGRGQCTPK